MKALGLIEVYGYPTAIEALDSAVKAANVSVVDMVKVSGGLVTVTVEGDVGAVKASMEAAEVAAKRIGNVLSVHVIARPDEGIGGIIAPEGKVVLEPMAEEVKATPVGKEANHSPVALKVELTPSLKPVAKKAGKHTLEQLSTMKVVDLRSLARELGNTGLTNKEIRFGNKEDLIAAILDGK